MWVCQYQVGWHRPNQTDQRGCFFCIFCGCGTWDWRMRSDIWWYMGMIQCYSIHAIITSHGRLLLIFVSQSWENCGLLKGTGLQTQIWIIFEGNDFYVNSFFLNSWVYERIIFANWCTKPGWIFINQKGEKTAAFSKKSGGFSTTAFAYKEFLDKGVLETEEKCAEWAVFTVMALVWYKKNRKLDCDFTTILGSRRCSISLQLTNWTLDSESRQVNGLNTSTRRSTVKSNTTCSKRVLVSPPKAI